MRPIDRIAQLHDLGRKYAKAHSEYCYLHDFRKCKLAMLKTKYSLANPEWSNIKCDDAARCDKEYLEVLEGRKVAQEISEAAFYELKTSHAGINIWQTQRADERAELRVQSALT